MAVVTIVMGSKSDYETVLPAYEILRKLGVDAEMKVMSAHRTPDEVAEFAKNAAESGVKVIVAAAGKAAHLAGFIAAHTVLPVIGLPVKSSTLDGLDSLLSVVQMPNGVPSFSPSLLLRLPAAMFLTMTSNGTISTFFTSASVSESSLIK